MEVDDREGANQLACKSSDNGISSPRISFSCDLADDASFISINLNLAPVKTEESSKNFEFSSSDRTKREMPTADELFFEGKLLPYWQTHHSEKLKNLSLTSSEEITAAKVEEGFTTVKEKENESIVRTWFIDDDPSPRPPKCTVLWKELLRLKTREKSSTLSPSSSSSSSELDMTKEKSRDSNVGSKNVKRVKKGLERTRSASIKIRPMVNVPICTLTAKQSTRPPLFPSKRER